MTRSVKTALILAFSGVAALAVLALPVKSFAPASTVGYYKPQCIRYPCGGE